ncbi:PTS transporter subunit EIIC [Photobacterium sp. BZF1]|uniref:PTS transporter subunit EIIC n=1 Tax=Photobacterium sp. BZF1 TaxID=1904457 RepID=UPI001653AF4F|nr:PTS transporter subunit EIIC [Photobacterium sp. BZF1]MBC7002383.1 PTS transporter subunit EIIC [Photobacterium sp. BZF1]
MANYSKIADQLIKVIGEDNIESIAHCATRLRIIVKNKDLIDDKKISDIDLVKGQFFTSGQYQVIFGTGIVNKVYDQLAEKGFAAKTASEVKQEAIQREPAHKRAMRFFSDVFVPLLPAIIATGVGLGLKSVLLNPAILAMMGLTPESVPQPLTAFLAAVTETAFVFLPALVCWSAYRVAGGSPSLGILLGLMLISPAFPNAWDVALNPDVNAIMLFDVIAWQGYQGSVLPSLVVGLMGAKIEKRLNKVVPDVLQLILVPILSVSITLFLALSVLGPALQVVEQGIGFVLVGLADIPFGIGGFIYGLFLQAIVVTGMHHIITMFEVMLVSQTGMNPIIALGMPSMAAQGAAALALAYRSRNKKIRAAGIPAGATVYLGITEPAIFGMNLRFGIRPFVVASIVGGFGGMAAALLELAAQGNGISMLPGILFYTYDMHQFVSYAALMLVTSIVAFIAVCLWGIPKKMIEDYPADVESTSSSNEAAAKKSVTESNVETA